MKTQFTLTFVIDLPYPDADADPDEDEKDDPAYTTPEDAIAEEVETFNCTPYLWFETTFEKMENPVLKGVILCDTTIDFLNARLNQLATELADLEESSFVFGVGKDRMSSLRKEYEETYTKLIQLKREE